jgi:hypothetical protein
MWSLSSSEEISTKIRDSYKQTRHAEDENQPLSVQPWGRDCDKRRYFLIEGQDDTYFRVYRENHRYTRNAQWYNMAGNIDEIRVLAEKLEKEDGSQAARTLSVRMTQAITRFEAGEEVCFRTEVDILQRSGLTCSLETPPTRIPSSSKASIHSSRAWILNVRRPHPWQAYALHLRRSRR